MGIENYSTTAANNNSSPPNGWPEGMAPSGVNNSARQNMADTRTWYENAQWIDYGYTYTYVSSTSFLIPTTDYTTLYHVGRRIKIFGTTTSTIYGTITASVYSTNTTITVALDSGTIQNEALTVHIGALTTTDNSIPYINKTSIDVASASTIDLDAVRGDLIDVTGTTTITAITLAEGQERTVRFTGILTLTDGASLVLPSGANITTAAGDFAIFRGYSSGVVRCVNYAPISGLPVVEPTIPPSSETVSGIAEIATDAEVASGVDDLRIVTPLKLKTELDSLAFNTISNFAGRKVYTASGTWTKPAGINRVIVEVLGGGGGGGGGGSNASATTGNNASGGGGGGAGGYSFEIISSGLGSSETITIGAAGAAGTGVYNTAGGTGGTGGTSSFGSFTSASGGTGGTGGGKTGGSGGSGGSGGVGSGGDINIAGGGAGDGATATAGGGGTATAGNSSGDSPGGTEGLFGNGGGAGASQGGNTPTGGGGGGGGIQCVFGGFSEQNGSGGMGADSSNATTAANNGGNYGGGGGGGGGDVGTLETDRAKGGTSGGGIIIVYEYT